MSIIVKLPALPNSSSKHFPKGIIYINNEDNALLKRRDEFDQRIAAVDEKFSHWYLYDCRHNQSKNFIFKK